MKQLILILLIGLSGHLFAQSGYQNITEKRIAFLSSRLPLSVEESQHFWPLYREYHQKREVLSRQKKLRGIKEKQMTEKEMEEFIDRHALAKKEEGELFAFYHQKYKMILPPDKIFELYRLDDEFNKNLLKELKKKGKKD